MCSTALLTCTGTTHRVTRELPRLHVCRCECCNWVFQRLRVTTDVVGASHAHRRRAHQADAMRSLHTVADRWLCSQR
jgi:hypothetical protein